MTALTEAEAKTKWCPFARSQDTIDNGEVSTPVTVNRNSMGPDPWCRCLASACMAWRWTPTQWEWADGDAVPEGAGWVSHSSADERFRWKRARPRDGYCGLAGQP